MSRLDKRWGWEEVIELNEHYMLKMLRVNALQKTSMHYHDHKVETLYVLNGEVEISFDDGRPSVVLRVNEAMTIQNGRANAHRMTAFTLGATYLEASTPHPDDNHRLYL